MDYSPIQLISLPSLAFLVNKYALYIFRMFLACLTFCAASLSKHRFEGTGEFEFLPEWWVASAIFIVTFTWYIHYIVTVINQITEFLDIYCLTIKRRTEPELAKKVE